MKLLPNQQLMFPHTNNSTPQFCNKRVVQGEEKEKIKKFNIKRRIKKKKKVYVTPKVKKHVSQQKKLYIADE
jgi:hypothetical protein